MGFLALALRFVLALAAPRFVLVAGALVSFASTSASGTEAAAPMARSAARTNLFLNYILEIWFGGKLELKVRPWESTVGSHGAARAKTNTPQMRRTSRVKINRLH